MSEEINDAGLVVPRALMTGIFINGLLGFSMILAVMGCMGDIDAMVNAQKTLLYPFIEVFDQATNSIAGSTVMAALIIVLGITGTVGALASCSRTLWAFSRDHGLPLWKTWMKVLRKIALYLSES